MFFPIPMRIGIDLGGTKIEILALDHRGQELLRRRVPTPAGDYPATLAALVGLVRETEAALGQEGSVGIGIPGAESLADGRVKNANSTCLIGHALGRDLEEALGRPVRLANDANCFALSEAADGAGQGAASVFGVILGTGVGGGIVFQGRVLVGANAIAGEWGHNPLPSPGAEDLPLPTCYCGRQGCIETYLSGPGLLADYSRQPGADATVKDGATLAARAAAGDSLAEAALSRYEARLARSLAAVINVLDPEVIVLGGGLSNLTRLYQAVPRLWGPYVFSDTVGTRLLPNRHGDSSGVRGAAWLWPQEPDLDRP